jgi:hypothetical protein
MSKNNDFIQSKIIFQWRRSLYFRGTQRKNGVKYNRYHSSARFTFSRDNPQAMGKLSASGIQAAKEVPSCWPYETRMLIPLALLTVSKIEKEFKRNLPPPRTVSLKIVCLKI